MARSGHLVIILIGFIITILSPVTPSAQDQSLKEKDSVQAHISLTVSESKRLIAKAVAQMPQVKKAMLSGMVIVTRGTTNTYIAEELLGRKIEHGAFVSGKVYPNKGAKRYKAKEKIKEVVLIDGKWRQEISLSDAVQKLTAGDVVIKGANALDYKNRAAGVYIGSPTGGTTGKIMPYVVARKAHLVIPVGLEKLVVGDLVELADRMQEPVADLNSVPSMFLLTGDIVTEIEALKVLADVSVVQCGAGGIGGAEGGVALLLYGPKDRVKRALDLVEGIYGEPAFVE